MKNKFLCLIGAIILLSTSLLSLSACESKSNTIIGRWEVSVEFDGEMSEIGIFEFKSDNTVTMTDEESGEVSEGTYSIDYDFTPHHLDFTIDNETGKTIIEFTDKNTFRMETINSPDDPRPVNFGDNGMTFTGERI